MKLYLKIIIATTILIASQLYLVNYNKQLIENLEYEHGERLVICPNGSYDIYNSSKNIYCDGHILTPPKKPKTKYLNEKIQEELWLLIRNQSQNTLR